MTFKIEDLIRWQWDYMSEEHVTNFFIRKMEKDWDIIYYNLPHGSWKFISFFKGDIEYRQEAPKRGKGRVKRPDLAMQDNNIREKVVCLLLECKKRREEMDQNLPEMLKAYFEGVNGTTPIYEKPFYHKRKRGRKDWIETKEVERFWLKNVKREYLYGFAYGLGIVKVREKNWSEEREWINKSIYSFPSDKIPPIFFATVAWNEKDFNPICVLEFSPTFPKLYKIKIVSSLNPLYY